jgi:hypothetical protein
MNSFIFRFVLNYIPKKLDPLKYETVFFNFAISLTISSTKRLAAILKISTLLYSAVGEYNSLIRQI